MSQHTGGVDGVPSAQVPDARVGANEVDEDDPRTTYAGSNLDPRGVEPDGRPQVRPDDPETLDAELDTSPRTDRTGQAAAGGDADDTEATDPSSSGRADDVDQPTRTRQAADDA